MQTKKALYHPLFFSILRPLVMVRDNFSCKGCGTVDKSNHVHHVTADVSTADMSLMLVLCPGCHNRANHGKLKFYNIKKVDQLNLTNFFYLLENNKL